MSELEPPIRRMFDATNRGDDGGGPMTFTLAGDRIATMVIRG
jgi:hypothetical protein